jgi:hypothetical protein
MKIIYAEDSQGYYTTYYLIETNCTGDLEALSWTPVPAGRFSTSVETLKELVTDLGLKFEILEDLGKTLPDGYVNLTVIKGATGNY